MGRLLGVVGALLLVGCGDPCGGEFRLDADLTERERELVRVARDRVNEWVGDNEVTILDVHEDSMCRVDITRLNPMPDGGRKHGKRSRGIGLFIDRQELLKAWGSERYEQAFVNITMHEMMHAIGFKHHPERGIMHPSVGPDDALTVFDRR